MSKDSKAENDVYERYRLKWADFPTAHHLICPYSDEAELFCATHSLAVYATYPNVPHARDHDYVASWIANASRQFPGGMKAIRSPIEDRLKRNKIAIRGNRCCRSD